jgi:hypothetical protein
MKGAGSPGLACPGEPLGRLSGNKRQLGIFTGSSTVVARPSVT